MTDSPAHRAIEAVWRIESARLIAGLARIVRDLGLAEELAQDSLVAALERWPESGVPDNPGAWLMAAAKHRAIDLLRRRTLLTRKNEELGRDLAARQETAMVDPTLLREDDFGDDLLRLLFMACHPVLAPEARAALTLRVLGGLTTAEIARAFLVSEPMVAQRIVRAKRALARERAAFEEPRGEERAARVSSVLEVIYLVHVGSGNALVSKPQGDDSDVHARLPHVHRSGVTKVMWANLTLGKGRALSRCALDRSPKTLFHAGSREGLTSAAGKQWGILLGVGFLDPVPEKARRGFPQGNYSPRL